VSGPPRPRWVDAMVLAIVVMIVWTVVVKYLVPIAWFWSERFAGREVAAVPVMWDFWPLLHVGLIVGLWTRRRWIWGYALTVAVAESLVVAAKFALYLRAPELGFWKLLWFTNKVYVLGLFLVLLFLLAGARGRELRAPGRGWA